MTDILNGVPWFDTNGDVVNAHGCGVVEENGTYYLFGESKTDDENRFDGFSCYSSPDLATWTFEGLALPPQEGGLLGPGRIGERPKVLRSPTTGRYVLFAHADDLGYFDPHIVIATCDRINGEFTFQGPLLHDGEPLRRWDMGTFQDEDGTGYVLTHEGDIFRLAPDYLSIEEQVAAGVAPGGESPAMLRVDDTYWLLLSNKTMWERNDNFTLSAPSIAGPWTHRGLLAPEGTLTFNSQCSFVLHTRGSYVYLGDRWSFPRQASAATQVWLPLDVSADSVRLSAYVPAWSFEGATEETADDGPPVVFRQADHESHFDTVVHGERIVVSGLSTPDSSYGRVEVSRGAERVLEHIVDFYSAVPSHGRKFVSPPLPRGTYHVRVSPTGERPSWSKKDGTRYGPSDAFVHVTGVSAL